MSNRFMKICILLFSSWRQKYTTKIIDAVSKAAAVAFSGKYLIYTNVTLASLFAGFGDIIEQKYESDVGLIEEWDVTRTKHMALTGTVMGAVSHFWYIILDGFFPGSCLKIVGIKILIDLLIGVPVDMMVFFGTFALLKGMNGEEFVAFVSSIVWKLYLAEMLVWPSAQFVNFYFLPRKYRVLYDNMVCLGYDIFISHLVNKKTTETRKGED